MKRFNPMRRTLVPLVLAAAAGSPVLAQTPDKGEGATVFESRCALCHRGSGPGVFMLERRVGKDLSILEERDNLTTAFLQAVVRNGIGSMPRFTRAEVTDAELAALASYLKAR